MKPSVRSGGRGRKHGQERGKKKEKLQEKEEIACVSFDVLISNFRDTKQTQGDTRHEDYSSALSLLRNSLELTYSLKSLCS